MATKNRLREKLAALRLPEDKYTECYPRLGYKWAYAILQSPEIREEYFKMFQEELREPRYTIKPTSVSLPPTYQVFDAAGIWRAEFELESDAQAYIDSKGAELK